MPGDFGALFHAFDAHAVAGILHLHLWMPRERRLEVEATLGTEEEVAATCVRVRRMLGDGKCKGPASPLLKNEMRMPCLQCGRHEDAYVFMYV